MKTHSKGECMLTQNGFAYDARSPLRKSASSIAALMLAFCMMFCTLGALPQTASAASAFDKGTNPYDMKTAATDYNAGNMFAIGHSVSDTAVENDLYWAGQSFDSNKLKVGTSGHGSFLGAGQKVVIKDATIADSVRIAAQDISLERVQVGNNITVAAQDISLGADVNANGLYAAAKDLSISGTYKGASLTGESVSFNGSVAGDLSIQAEHISIGKNAKVEGTLTVPEGVDVAVADGAQIPTISYSEPIQVAEPTMFDNMLTILYACMAHIVLVGLFFVIIRKSLVRSANMAREQLVKMLLAGLVIFIVAPILCLLLIFPLITIPVVVLMVLVMVTIALFSLPFTGSALGLMLLGKRMNPVLAAVIGTVVLTILAYIPFVATITVIFCIMFTAGYLWMCYWELHKERKQERFAARQAALAESQPSPFAGVSGPPVPPPPTQAPTDDAADQPAGENPAPPAPPEGSSPVIPPAPTDASQGQSAEDPRSKDSGE